MYRTDSFDKLLSGKLQDPAFATEFLLSSMEGEDGLSLVDALKRVICCMGIKEYSKISGIHRSSISRMIAQNEIPKIETLDRYLQPFNLKARVEVEEVA